MTATIRSRPADGVAAGAAFGTLALVAGTGVSVPCPFRSLTGWACPLCGGSRMFRDLVHLDVLEALHHNALALSVLVPIAIAWLTTAAYRRALSSAADEPHRPFLHFLDTHRSVSVVALLGVLVVWTSLRNTVLAAWDTAV